jgi:tetratricopeptide (TPR) repeat protein
MAALAGCAGQTAAPQPPTTRPPIEVAPLVVSPYADAELEQMFERARGLLMADKYRESGEIFDRLARLSPDGKVAPPSLYNGGAAAEGLGDRAGAVARYRALLQRFPDHLLARSARLRLVRLLAYLERWGELATEADAVLKLPELTVLESIEGHGMRGLALVEQDRVDEAYKSVATARDLVEEHRLGEAGKPPIEIASVSFAMAEIRKRRSEKIVFIPVPPNFAEVLERRCTGLLEAQNAYTDAMRSLDAHWSAMAGYRVGQLYQQLHRDVMQVPPPPKAVTLKQKQLFEGAMRLRYRILLEKGLKMMDATVRLSERTGEASGWINRAKQAKRELELALEDERTAMSKLPYSEEELREALDKLSKGP